MGYASNSGYQLGSGKIIKLSITTGVATQRQIRFFPGFGRAPLATGLTDINAGAGQSLARIKKINEATTT